MDSRIVVVGSSNTDMILKLARIPRPGETILGGRFATAAGGKGANQAVAAARAGADVAFVARVGNDMFGQQAIEGFKKDGIDVSYVSVDPAEPSGVALIFVAEDGENSIGVAPGANAKLAAANVQEAEPAFAGADALLLQLEIPEEAVAAAVELGVKHNLTTILNPAPARPLPAELLKQITILTPNETETELLAGVEVKDEVGAEQAAGKLIQRGVQTVIVTLGARGALIVTAEGSKLIGGFEVAAVDATAAGDVFNGALAVALAEGKPLAEAVRFANAAAAISVTRLGAQPSAPSRAEIEQFLQKQPAR